MITITAMLIITFCLLAVAYFALDTADKSIEEQVKQEKIN